MLKVLDLFAGIGGFSLGLHMTGGFETVAFVERDDYASKVLAKNFPGVPIYDDVRTFNADGLGRIDCVTGGYPCQPFSLAGKRDGEKDDRHLWPEMLRIVAATRPRWVIAENVAGHISMGLDEVLSDLEGESYTCQAVVIPACAVDAIHRRDRVWIIAHSNSRGGELLQHELVVSGAAGQGRENNAEDCVVVSANPLRKRPQGQGGAEGQFSEKKNGNREKHRTFDALQWPTKPAVRGRDDGISRKLDRHRLRCLGNAVVPQVVAQIGRAILEAEKEKEK